MALVTQIPKGTLFRRPSLQSHVCVRGVLDLLIGTQTPANELIESRGGQAEDANYMKMSSFVPPPYAQTSLHLSLSSSPAHGGLGNHKGVFQLDTVTPTCG